MNLNNIFSYFGQKYKLTLRNIRSGEEIWHIFISRIRMTMVLMATVLVIFIVILTTIAYTPILDLVPGYPGNRARKALISNIMRLDSLERMVIQWEDYQTNLALILEGKAPIPFDPDSLPKLGIKSIPARRSESDSLLRKLMETDSSYLVNRASHRRSEGRFEIMPPANGAITRHFDIAGRFFGTSIATLPNQVIMSVMDGTVVINSWDPVAGYVIAVQHTGNMMSIYKITARPLKQVGERVKAGEALAVTATSSSGKAPDLVFELWYNGNPVDPENYITF